MHDRTCGKRQFADETAPLPYGRMTYTGSKGAISAGLGISRDAPSGHRYYSTFSIRVNGKMALLRINKELINQDFAKKSVQVKRNVSSRISSPLSSLNDHSTVKSIVFNHCCAINADIHEF